MSPGKHDDIATLTGENQQEEEPSVEVTLTQETYRSFLAHQIEKDISFRGVKLCLTVSVPCICLIVMTALGVWDQMAWVMASIALSLVWIVELIPEIWRRTTRTLVHRRIPDSLGSCGFVPVTYKLCIDGIEVAHKGAMSNFPYASLRACVPFSDMTVIYLDEKQAFPFPIESFDNSDYERRFFWVLEHRWADALRTYIA